MSPANPLICGPSLRHPGSHVPNNCQSPVYLQLGDLTRAEASCREALRLDPALEIAHKTLGDALRAAGHLDAAEACYRRALALRPDWSATLNDLGLLLIRRGAWQQALECLEASVRLAPDDARAAANLGAALRSLGRIEEARRRLEDCIARHPDHAPAWAHLGLVHADRGEQSVAEGHFRRALALDPRLPSALNNLGLCLLAQWRLAEAESVLRDAVARLPDVPECRVNLAMVLGAGGQVAETMECLRDATRVRGHMDPGTHSSLLFCLNYLPDAVPESVAEEHRCWGRLYAYPQSMRRSPQREPDPDRVLRIGYVSPDFREHSVARFLAPLLRAHDRSRVVVYSYADIAQADGVTERLKGLSDHWREIRGWSDEELARRIDEDAIDILIDLAGHTAGSRLRAFSLRPAPIQGTYLGYPNTTGLAEIDFRLTDAWADPPGMTESFYTEELERLPGGFLCFEPPESAPPVRPRPSRREGEVVFGSFNNPAKLGPPVLRTWGRILRELPGARLVLKSRGFGDAATRKRFLARFEAAGIAPRRLELIEHTATVQEHLGLYNVVDIALDPFPYHGTTTTCEALWMGVPVVSLAGRVHAARVGVSLLSRVGLDELVATDEDEYVGLALALAAAPERLRALHRTLRERTAGSPLCDHGAVAREVEAVYRRRWRAWCRGRFDAQSRHPPERLA